MKALLRALRAVATGVTPLGPTSSADISFVVSPTPLVDPIASHIAAAHARAVQQTLSPFASYTPRPTLLAASSSAVASEPSVNSSEAVTMTVHHFGPLEGSAILARSGLEAGMSVLHTLTAASTTLTTAFVEAGGVEFLAKHVLHPERMSTTSITNALQVLCQAARVVKSAAKRFVG